MEVNAIPCAKCNAELFRLNAKLVHDVEVELLLNEEAVRIVSIEHYHEASSQSNSNTISYHCLACGYYGKIYTNYGGQLGGSIDY